MIYPSADTIEERVGSRYSLVVLAAKRAKQLKEGAPVLIDTHSTNLLTIAMEEIAAGKVTPSGDLDSATDNAANPLITETAATDEELLAETLPLAVDEFDPMLGGPGAAEESR